MYVLSVNQEEEIKTPALLISVPHGHSETSLDLKVSGMKFDGEQSFCRIPGTIGEGESSFSNSKHSVF